MYEFLMIRLKFSIKKPTYTKKIEMWTVQFFKNSTGKTELPETYVENYEFLNS